MAGQFGVDNLIKIADVLLEGANVAEKMLKDEGNTMAKAAHAMLLFDELMMLPSTDFTKLDDEIKELDAEDKSKLEAHFKLKLNLADDQVEQSVERIFSMLLKVEGIVKELVALVASFKEESKEAKEAPTKEVEA